jgi:hypothetical protein
MLKRSSLSTSFTLTVTWVSQSFHTYDYFALDLLHDNTCLLQSGLHLICCSGFRAVETSAPILGASSDLCTSYGKMPRACVYPQQLFTKYHITLVITV